MLAKPDLISAKLGPDAAKIWTMPVTPGPWCVKLERLRADVVQAPPSLVRFLCNRGDFGRSRSKFGVDIGQIWADLGRTRACFGQAWDNFGRRWPQIRQCFGPTAMPSQKPFGNFHQRSRCQRRARFDECSMVARVAFFVQRPLRRYADLLAGGASADEPAALSARVAVLSAKELHRAFPDLCR